MKIKRFTARSMREAIRLVREEQGEDAVILSNRRVPEGVEVVAATDYDAALAQQAMRAQAPPPEAPDRPASRKPSAPPQAAAPAPAPQAAPAAAPPGAELAQVRRELGSVRALIEQQLSGLMWNEMNRSQPQRAATLRALARFGIDADVARTLTADAPIPGGDGRAHLLPQALLARRILVNPADQLLAGGMVALVGPTGVGKTTTLAKLAARFIAAHRPRDLALVSLDHYRIGAQEQIYCYARKLGVAVHHVGPDQDLETVLAELSGYRLVLIDTAGMSPRDRVLAQQIERLARLGEQLSSYVVLAADSGNADEVLRRFAALKPAGCILTKMDEAASLGTALSAVIRRRLPLSYITHGQRVPEDIYLPQAERLVLCAAQMARITPRVLDEDALARRLAAPTLNPAAQHA